MKEQVLLAHEQRERYLITTQMLREYHKLRKEESSIATYTIFCYQHRLWERLEYLNED